MEPEEICQSHKNFVEQMNKKKAREKKGENKKLFFSNYQIDH